MDWQKQQMICDSVEEIAEVFDQLSSMLMDLSSLLYPDEEDCYEVSEGEL